MSTRLQPIHHRSASTRQAWKDLAAHYKKIWELHRRQIFQQDPKRGERLIAEAVGICLDYSKNLMKRSSC
jgi:glucose-6-phosphate isomerase